MTSVDINFHTKGGGKNDLKEYERKEIFVFQSSDRMIGMIPCFALGTQIILPPPLIFILFENKGDFLFLDPVGGSIQKSFLMLVCTMRGALTLWVSILTPFSNPCVANLTLT